MENQLNDGFVVVHWGAWIQHFWCRKNVSDPDELEQSIKAWVRKLDRRILHLKSVLKGVST